VKTLPATMLDTEREEFSGTGPSSRSRFAAVALERPCSVALSVIDAYSIG
jgi:hypothetical protein